MKATPVTISARPAAHTTCSGASPISETENSVAPTSIVWRLARPSDAENSAPMSAPKPKSAERMPKISGPLSSVRAASTGSSTLKLMLIVAITSIITSTERITGRRHANFRPSRDPRNTF